MISSVPAANWDCFQHGKSFHFLSALPGGRSLTRSPRECQENIQMKLKSSRFSHRSLAVYWCFWPALCVRESTIIFWKLVETRCVCFSTSVLKLFSHLLPCWNLHLPIRREPLPSGASWSHNSMFYIPLWTAAQIIVIMLKHYVNMFF